MDWERFEWEALRRRGSVRATRLRVLRWRAPLAAAAMLALVCTGYFALRGDLSEPARLDRQVFVQVRRPVDLGLVSDMERTVVVRANRTPPPSYSAPVPTGKSYLIATAGAKPIEANGPPVEAGSFF